MAHSNDMHTPLNETAPPISLDQMLELVGSAQQGIGIYDETDTLVYANGYFRQLLDVDAHSRPTWKDIMRSNHRDQSGNRICTPDFEVWLASAASRRGKLPFRSFESDMHDGRWMHVAETTLANGWMFSVLTDITELGASERVVRQQRDLAMRAALSDPLTGLSNRRHMQEVLGTLQASGQLQGAAVVLLDLDHFKRVNDAHGHDRGDMLLQHFAKLLQRLVRREDLAARWGGEEFLLLLPDVTKESAQEVVERVLKEVRLSAPLEHQPDFRYTCSAGWTLFQCGESVNEALKRADDALYEAKRAGRDGWLAR
jgi:diguanylate cyclase (GGDEF)-like protein